MARIDIRSNGGGSVATGVLQLQGGVAMTSTLTAVTDQSNTASPLQLSTTAVQVTSPLRITTSDASGFYLDAEDSATNNRFSIKRDPSSQLVTLDFASNPAGSTTSVGAIRTYVDGVNLSEAMTFREDGNVGIGTTTPQGKLDVRTTDGFGSVQIYSNNNSSLPLRLFRANDGLVGINTFSSGGTIDSPSNKATLGEITRLTGNAYVDGAYRPLASMEYYLDAIPTAGAAPCSIRFLTVAATSSTYALNERMGITNDGNVQINESIVTNRNAKLFIKGSGSTSATTSFLVQNSSGFNAIQVTDDLKVNINTLVFGGNNGYIGINNSPNIDSALRRVRTDGGQSALFISTGEVGVGDATTYASAIFAIGSTTRGFLPPRMTTAQKLAIGTPAAGLQVYDSTLNQMSYYNGTTWINF